MIYLDEYDMRLIQDIGKRQYKNYKIFDIEDKNYILKDELIALIDNLNEEYLLVEERLLETSNKLDEVWKEKQGSWLDAYIRTKMRCEELEEKIEAMKSCFNEDMYDKLHEEGIEI